MKNKIILLLLSAISINSSGQGNRLDKLITDYAYQHQFSGTVLVQKQGKILNSSAFGMANIPFDIPNRMDTKFQIASITKLFTAVLILQLYEEGKLDLNGTIHQYLPDYTGEAAQKVSIHQLLNHTSGMENMESIPDPEFKFDWLSVYGKPYTSDQILGKFCTGKMIHEPGSKFDYNNGEYIILGKIIERIYGRTYTEVLKDQLLGPLGMSASGMCIQSGIKPVIADTYSINTSTKLLEKDEPAFIQNWYAAGAMYSTTTDLMNFVNSLFSYKLLKKETVDILTRPGLDNYGYGTWIRGKDHKAMERYGRIRGTNTVILRFLDTDLTVIILGNTDRINNLGPFAYHIANSIK
jgi:D-alanyl-D-alanine carboxypeptidase